MDGNAPENISLVFVPVTVDNYEMKIVIHGYMVVNGDGKSRRKVCDLCVEFDLHKVCNPYKAIRILKYSHSKTCNITDENFMKTLFRKENIDSIMDQVRNNLITRCGLVIETLAAMGDYGSLISLCSRYEKVLKIDPITRNQK